MILTALLKLITNFGKVFQVSYNGKTKNNIRNLNSYGFWSSPPKGSKVVLIRDFHRNYYGIAYKNDKIPELKEGETIIGNFSLESFIKFSKTGKINISNENQDLLTSLTELKTVLKTSTFSDNTTPVFGTTTQTALETFLTNLEKLLE